MKKIIITGALGYIGYPLFKQLRDDKRYEVIGVDNNSRADWVERVGGKQNRIIWESGVIYGDLTDRNFVKEVIAIHKPDVVIHLASQPSMPYSQINSERALFTQMNNVSMNLNLLWALKECGLTDTRYIVTTTTGIPGQSYRSIPEAPVNNQAGSWYHVSRGFDSANCSLASRQWNMNCIEYRTAIVYGIKTEHMRANDISTRYDTDFYFGTVLNRFIKQAQDGEFITVYGEGLQTKPFISLEDTVRSLINGIEYKFLKGHTILNQTTEMMSIDKLANIIQDNTSATIKRIPNPRKENETFIMKFDNKKFLKVLNKKPDKACNAIKDMIDDLEKKDYWTITTSNTDSNYSWRYK